MDNAYIFPLSDPRASLERVGGKGASLARLCGAGLPIPDGFHITTAAYRAFVAENGLQPAIVELAQSANIAQPESLEMAARAIQERFLQGRTPGEIEQAISQAYGILSAGANPAVVAVRSSATAEDLPEASFAGQQETYLNICGAEAVLEAVKKCWASLWTARAMAYRARQGIESESVALAVVVQQLVFADASGVLFTANPISGKRDEVMITAAWGLGEAIVGGVVTPDTLIVEKGSGRMLRRETHEKQVMTIRVATGTKEQPVPKNLQKEPVLNDAQAAELASLGAAIEQLYSFPMDIEWTLAGGRFAIVQARPITSLPPEWIRPLPHSIYARSSLAEHLPNPATPLFATLGLRVLNVATTELAETMGFDARELNYDYRTINGYVFLGFLFTPGAVWKTLKGSFSLLGKMFGPSRQRWQEASEKLGGVMAPWEAAAAIQADLSALPARDLLSGADEVFTQVGRPFTVLQSSALPLASSSEGFFFCRLSPGSAQRRP